MKNRKGLAILVLVTFVLLSAICAIGANGQFNKTDSKITESLLKNENMRVYVEFNEDANNKGLLSDVKRTVADSVSSRKIHNDFGNIITLDINENDLNILESDGRIKSIKQVDAKQLFLSQSVPLINGTTAWTLKEKGINLTGIGETVCVLDSGVNYTHPDLGGCYGNNSLSSTCKVWGGWDYVDGDSDPYDKVLGISSDGHGTHVSGIVAANRTVRGVAPDARLVVVRICGTGGCYDDDIKAGIDWCVNNASAYNISVISMSLGGGLYSNYCDYTDDPLNITVSINNAAAKNISVVIAAGNDGSTTQISSPACIQNATPVGSIRKDDSTFDYNRNFMVQLIAPGYDITSTYFGGYASGSGTSMATPHVSGAVAILHEYLRLTGQTKTAGQVESKLNSTGRSIYDSASGLNYSRIDVYGAVVALDVDKPNVTLIVPADNYINSTVASLNLTFRCNATDLSLKNVSLYLWNSSSLYSRTSANISGAINTFEANITNIAQENYKWNCLYGDENGNSGFASSNRSFTYDLAAPFVTFSSPANTTYNTKALSVSITNLSDVSYVWWYNGTENLTYSSPILYNFSEGSNTIIAYANDSLGNINSTSITFFIDSINPDISFVSANTTSGIITNQNIFAYVLASDANLKNITINLYNSTGIVNSTNSTTSPFSVNFTDLSDGIYYFNATAYDTIGNLNFTETRNVSVNVYPPVLTITSPANNSWYNAFRFNVTLNEEGFCWFSTDNGLTNQSMTNYSSSVYYFVNTSVAESSVNNAYNATFYCNDSANNINSSSTKFFGVDKTAPSVSPSSPADSASYTGTQTISFQFTVTDNTNLTQCALVVAGSAVYNTSAITSSTNTITKDLASGSNYTWYVNCTDLAGNVGKSSSRTLSVNSASSNDAGGGGGGAITTGNIPLTSSYLINSTALSAGYTKAYYSGDSLRFSFVNSAGIAESHTMKIDYIGAGYANFTITSNPIKLTLYLGQETRLNLTSNNYYDLYIKLESVKGGRVNVTIKSIHELIPAITTGLTGEIIFPNVTNPPRGEINFSSNETGKSEEKSKVSGASLYIVLAILTVIVIRVGIYLFVRWRRSRKPKHK